LWKRELQKLAAETRLEISVCHFPPGTSQWNKIEHRLFSFLTKNWRGDDMCPLRMGFSSEISAEISSIESASLGVLASVTD
jgi:hypothetical protein